MKKITLLLFLAGFLYVATPVVACEGKKCTMEHPDKNSKKKKKGKKEAKAESCHKTETTSENGVKACCMNKSQAEAGKEKGKN